MSFNIVFTDVFRRSLKTLVKRHPSLSTDIKVLLLNLADSPEMGTSLGSNLFKIRLRITSKGRGKSGGARIITCVIYKTEQVLLANIYDKSDYSSADEKTIIKNLKAEGFDL